MSYKFYSLGRERRWFMFFIFIIITLSNVFGKMLSDNDSWYHNDCCGCHRECCVKRERQGWRSPLISPAMNLSCIIQNKLAGDGLFSMPYRWLCNDVQHEGVKASLDLASGLFCYVPLHNIWYGTSPGIDLAESNLSCPQLITSVPFCILYFRESP